MTSTIISQVFLSGSFSVSRILEKVLSFICQPHQLSPKNLLDKCHSLVDFPWCFHVLTWNYLMQISIKFFLEENFLWDRGTKVVLTIRRKYFCVSFLSGFRFELTFGPWRENNYSWSSSYCFCLWFLKFFPLFLSFLILTLYHGYESEHHCIKELDNEVFHIKRHVCSLLSDD